MDITTLISETRTCRRFDEHFQISMEQLHGYINLARLSGSARNCQPWQYMAINDKTLCEKIFPHLGWAGFLTDWKGPKIGERPSAYILCLLNHQWLSISEREAYFDLGSSTQNLLLGAKSENIMGCRIASFSKKVQDMFTFPEHLNLELIIALGKPVEKICIEDVGQNGDIKYWRDESKTHHVPKRVLRDIVVDLPTSPKNI